MIVNQYLIYIYETIIKFDKPTGEMALGGKNGDITTLFKPEYNSNNPNWKNDALNYFRNEQKR